MINVASFIFYNQLPKIESRRLYMYTIISYLTTYLTLYTYYNNIMERQPRSAMFDHREAKRNYMLNNSDRFDKVNKVARQLFVDANAPKVNNQVLTTPRLDDADDLNGRHVG